MPLPPPADDGAPLPPVPGFAFESLLGRGGFAWVFAARREADGRAVAVKLARAPRDPRFIREAEALRRVGPPTVPELLAEGELEGRPYLVLEKLAGRPLSEWQAALPGAGEAPLKEALHFFGALCEAVSRLHRVGLIHRDLKPENVFLRQEGRLCLLDLGLARDPDGDGPGTAAPEDLTRAGQQPGTVLYMSPEQCAGEGRLDARTDVYSLGVVLFELLTGRPPFAGDAADVLRGHASLRPPRPSELSPRAALLDELVLRCLAKERARRFADAAGVLEAFTLAAVRAPRASSPAPFVPETAARRTRPVPLLGVAARGPVTELAATIEPEGGVIVRLHEELYVVAFPEHASTTAGLRAALRAASRWGRDKRVVHLAELRVRPGQTSPRLAGAALEQARGWWDAAPDDAGTWLTPAATPLMDRGYTAEGPGGHHLLQEEAFALARNDTATVVPPLIGREALLAELEQDARDALRRSQPTLRVLPGEIGIGKTRVLEALAEALGRAPGLRLIPLRAEVPHTGTPGRTLAELLRLGPGLSPEEAQARVRDLSPEAQRHALARLIGDGLRRLAAEQPLAILLDDAQWADAVSLDALEVASLAESGAPLWICATALPELLELRPGLGDRAGRSGTRPLPPLEGEASRALLRELMRPVEYVPAAALDRLEALARGVPLYGVELVRALRASGAIRRDPLSGAWTLAPDELLNLSATSLFERLGERALSTLPGNVRALAELCAVLGDGLTLEALAAAQARLEPVPELASLFSLDPGVGLSRLVRAGLLRAESDGRQGFQHPLLREALETGIPPWRRRLLHRAAFRALAGADDAEPALLRRRARHAAESFESEIAFEAYFRLAEQARLAHCAVEAEQAYSAALEQLAADGGERRQRALAGRGMVRYRSHRYREAREDLGQAAALALARGDRVAGAGLLLEEATVLDWMEDWEGSQALVQRALELGEGCQDGPLALRLRLAQGRLEVRGARWEEAARILEATAADAARAGEHEVRAIALVLLASVLTLADRLDEAEAVAETAITHCRATGDLLHLAGVYINRGLLWQKRQAVDRAIEDLRVNLSLAREMGHAQIERIATFNLAEFLHYLGRWEEALPLAQRAHELGLRFFRDAPIPMEALLLARIAAATGDLAEARRQVAWIETQCAQPLQPGSAAQLGMVRQVLAEAGDGGFSPAAWEALIAQARQDGTPDERLEVMIQAGNRAAATGAWTQLPRLLEELRGLAEQSPLWSPRLAALEQAARERRGP